MREYTFYVRNLTKRHDFPIALPVGEEVLNYFVDKNCEYMVVSGDIDYPEYISVANLNSFLTKAGRLFGKEELSILLRSYLFSEIEEALNTGREISLYDFDELTSTYNGGNGVIPTDWWKGYILRELGHVDFPFEYKEEMENYINFDALWTDASCNEDWREIWHDNHLYLAKIW